MVFSLQFDIFNRKGILAFFRGEKHDIGKKSNPKASPKDSGAFIFSFKGNKISSQNFRYLRLHCITKIYI